MEWLAGFRLPDYELTQRDGQYELRFEGLWARNDDVGDPRARDHQRTARARRDARHEPLRSRRALRPRQGQAVEQGRAAARARRAKGRCGSPISAPAAATAFCGSAGASRRCRRASATVSSAPPTSSTRWTPASRRSAPTRTNCRWSTPRSPTTTRRCARRPITVLRDWARMYGGNLLVVLPDCFGTTAFLARRAGLGGGLEGRAARLQGADRRRARTDRLVAATRPRPAREAASCSPTRWTSSRSRRAARALRGQVNLSIGWGTNLTNDFNGCAPAGVDGELKAISLVCKVVEADGRPAVKLSDNPNKVLGPPEEIERYLRVFGEEGMAPTPGQGLNPRRQLRQITYGDFRRGNRLVQATAYAGRRQSGAFIRGRCAADRGRAPRARRVAPPGLAGLARRADRRLRHRRRRLEHAGPISRVARSPTAWCSRSGR